MSSSTSLEGDLDTTATRSSIFTHHHHHHQQQHKHLSRSRQRARSKHSQQLQHHPASSSSNSLNLNTSSFDQKAVMGSNTVSYTALEVDPIHNRQIRTPSSASSNNKNNIRLKRNLREKRRPTGIVHIISTESTGGTSSETEEEGLDDDLNVKKNTKMNEIVFLPLPTAHLRALAAQHAAAKLNHDQDNDDEDDEVADSDENQDAEDEDDGLLLRDRDAVKRRESVEDSTDGDPPLSNADKKTENERLRDQLKFKDKYIKQLEARVFQLEIQQHQQPLNKRNQ